MCQIGHNWAKKLQIDVEQYILAYRGTGYDNLKSPDFLSGVPNKHRMPNAGMRIYFGHKCIVVLLLF